MMTVYGEASAEVRSRACVAEFIHESTELSVFFAQ